MHKFNSPLCVVKIVRYCWEDVPLSQPEISLFVNRHSFVSLSFALACFEHPEGYEKVN